MSRSYRKFLSYPNYDFNPPEWFAFRMKERRCIQHLLQSLEDDDVVFPKYYHYHQRSWGSSARFYCPKKNIRNDYNMEISKILNGYQGWWSWKDLERHSEQPHEDYQKAFIESFYRIKSGESLDVKKVYRYEWPIRFEWLNTHEVKEAIKKWEGDPLDVLYFLTYSGIIEKAVNNECKKIARK